MKQDLHDQEAKIPAVYKIVFVFGVLLSCILLIFISVVVSMNGVIHLESPFTVRIDRARFSTDQRNRTELPLPIPTLTTESSYTDDFISPLTTESSYTDDFTKKNLNSTQFNSRTIEIDSRTFRPGLSRLPTFTHEWTEGSGHNGQ